MFGCVGSREKSLPPSSVEPCVLRGVSRGTDSVTFEFSLQAVGDGKVATDSLSCQVQSLEAGTLQSNWVPVANASWRELAPTEVRGPVKRGSGGASKRDQVRCLAVAPGLLPEKDYTFRLLARGSLKEQSAFSAPFVVRTSDRPKPEGAALLCSRRWADSIEVEWPLADPDGAPVEECLAQCRLDGLMSSWMPEVSLTVVDSGSIPEGGCRRWRGRLSGVSGATTYRVRARARNAVGWAASFSPELTCTTSYVPSAPKGLVCLRRQPNSVTIWMLLEDPEGAPVQTCSAQIHGVLGYSVQQSRFLRVEPAAATMEGGPGKVVRPALCIVDGLQPETEYFVRLWVQNASGAARQPSLPLQVFTSDRPRPPTQLWIMVGPRVIDVEWELIDPVGAPVLSCELEYGKDTVFSSWQAVVAEPVRLMDGGSVKSDVPTEVTAAVLVAQAAAVAPVVRRWRLRIDGLERETAYALRVRAKNSIGWSSAYSHTERTATSDRPCSPQGLQCVARLPAAVRLEFSVPEVLGRAPVSQIHIEQCGSFSWQEVQEVEITRADTQTPGVSHWSVLVTLDMDPTVVHKLRAWASNDFGRCSEPSPACLCRTSDRPSTLPALECIQRLPYALVLSWSVPDPEGAPIRRFEIQSRRDQALAGWQTAVCADTTQCEVDPGTSGDHSWRCVVEQLEPNSAYRLSVRAHNEIGWSEWYTPEAVFETSGPPVPPTSLAARVAVDASVAGIGEEQEYLVVDLELPDPEGAPVVACMVRCLSQGIWTLCRREEHSSPGRWHARLPQERGSQDVGPLSVSVRSANAVGWSRHEGTPSAAPAGAGSGGEAGCASSAVELVFGEVRESLAAQRLSKARLLALSAEATAHGDHDHAALIARHRVEIEKRMEVLEEVEQQMGSVISSGGEDPGQVLVTELNQALRRRKLVPNPSAAAKILSLLLRGYMWLETSWRSELKSLSSGIAQAMESATASGGRILWHWAKQHQSWSQSFENKVSETLPEGLASSAQLLTTLASGRKLELFESVRSDLSACLTLVSAAERQLKRLRMSYRVLHAAEAASCHDFERKGVLRKIESTALGIVTMMVLPLPGAIEVGTLGIGMMWLEGDAANSHLALQHPTGVPLAPILERLGSCPPPRAAVILAGWASGGHRGVVLVHNATARRITVTATPDKGASLASKAFAKLSDAHPMVKLVGYAMSESDGGDHVATVLPTDVVLIQVPDESTSGQSSARLEFSYGPATHAEKTVGWAVVRPGSALSFVRLDSSLQVSNGEGENASVEEGTIRLVNNDLAPVSVSVFRAPEKQNHFETALLTELLESGEEKRVPLPQPCTGRIFQVEVRHDNKQKMLCEVRAGQCITVEGCV
mmetsp:Transcript_35398/g.101715  ORF Transcript_35398/g.101715 Transcript_35398/m.101715 type:complete len:1361 (-) Transcript_35398:40-4122(-)